jgi:hypothetical protein
MSKSFGVFAEIILDSAPKKFSQCQSRKIIELINASLKILVETQFNPVQ